jgi:ElaB/YqjD/DUF883 family membrane-anchored ribosome-binding protein
MLNWVQSANARRHAMDSRGVDAKIDAAAEKAKELTSKLDEAGKQAARKAEDVIAEVRDTATGATKKAEHRMSEGLEGAAHRVQEKVTKLAHRAEELADKLSGKAETAARKLQHHRAPSTHSPAGAVPTETPQPTAETPHAEANKPPQAG